MTSDTKEYLKDNWLGVILFSLMGIAVIIGIISIINFSIEYNSWQCEKPREHCRVVKSCTKQGYDYCLQFEDINKCDNVCDLWRHKKTGEARTKIER